ncbi:MAG TPA: hypothetical protein VMV94_20440, partial [Phycisphaerae bacterium]|nr:hypothetical protein [Phycisphaerae bacterium]
TNDSRTTSLYLASEFGCDGGTITGIAYYITDLPYSGPYPMHNLNIRLKQTNALQIPPSFPPYGWTTCYQGSPMINHTGWWTFTFTTPFIYSTTGPPNLLVDVSFDNSGNPGDAYWVWTVDTGGSLRSLWFGCDDCACGGPDPLTWTFCEDPYWGSPWPFPEVPRVQFLFGGGGPTGACCQPDGSCSITTLAGCTGTYQGDGTTCTPNPCPQPGACCQPSGSCSVTLQAACTGTWQGAGTTCTPNPCPQPGACCQPNGNCSVTLQAACTGTWQGAGTTCTPNPCPQPGACCTADGTCRVVMQIDCTYTWGGTWQGPNTTCTPNPCPLPQGACCFPDAYCEQKTQAGCQQAGGTAWSMGQPCIAGLCPLCQPQQEAKLIPSDGPAYGQFGTSVAESGDTLAVGSLYGRNETGLGTGAVYVYIRSGGVWTQQAKLTPGDPADYMYFGSSVALDGDTLIVGASIANGATTQSGAAYVFTRSGTTWTQQAKLIASDGAQYDYFGNSVAVDGDTTVIGAYMANVAGAHSGAAYVFARSGTTWSQQAKLVPSDAAGGDRFGNSVALSGDTAIVGAYMQVGPGSAWGGAAYAFVRLGTSWTQQAKLLPLDAAYGDYFGSSVALEGDTTLIGALNKAKTGAAYVFTRSIASWTQQAKLTAADAAWGDDFGYAVALAGDTAVIGSYYDSNERGLIAGSAYVFVQSGGSWMQRAKLVAADGAAEDYFGYSVALEGKTAAVGAYKNSNPGGTHAGAAYVYDLNCPGACCFQDGHCEQLLQAACAGGGTSWTMDAPCDPNPCPHPGACCFDDGTCMQILQALCMEVGGRVWTMDAPCDPDPCPHPGACCFDDGTCIQMLQAACTQSGGTSWTMDALCDPNPCPPPVGACCWWDGHCEQLPYAACMQAEGSAWMMNTPCEPNPCPQWVGACCFNDGHCEQLTYAACTQAGGKDWIIGVPCDPNPCPHPGACCFHDGHCEQLLQADCTQAGGTAWMMDWPCEPNPCLQPPGACCFHDGHCEQLLQVECTQAGGTGWTIDALCFPNPCPRPPGACCFQNGHCEQLLHVDCLQAGGSVWIMGAPCEPNPCPPPTGACCLADGSCAVTTHAACNGVWQGDGTVCDPNPCPFIKGDVNCDHAVDTADIPYFVAALIGGYTGCDISLADMNNSGTQDGLDIQLFVDVLLNE